MIENTVTSPVLPREGRAVYLIGREHVELRSEVIRAPVGNELLLRVEAALTCGTDVKVYRRGGHPTMLQAPCPFGHEVAGQVIAVGDDHELWQAGDRIVVSNSLPCSSCDLCQRGRQNLCPSLRYLNGAFADFLLVPGDFAVAACYEIPDGLSADVAALTEPLACVLHCIHSLQPHFQEIAPRPTDVVLYGAGPMGLLMTMMLTELGHRTVCADPNPSRLELAGRAGAAETLLVDRQGGQAERVKSYAMREAGFDVAIDATGSPVAWSDAVASVAPAGEVVLYGGCAPGSQLTLDTGPLHYSELTVRGVYHHRPSTFAEALAILAAGRLETDLLLSSPEPLENVEQALRKMMDKSAVKVVIHPRRQK